MKTIKKPVLLSAENAKAKHPYVSDCPVCALGDTGSDIVVGIDLPESPWRVYCVSCANLGPAALSPEIAVKKWNEYCEVTMKQMAAKLPVPVDCPQCGSAVTCIYPKGNKWQIACKPDCLKGPLAGTPQLALEAWGIKK